MSVNSPNENTHWKEKEKLRETEHNRSAILIGDERAQFTASFLDIAEVIGVYDGLRHWNSIGRNSWVLFFLSPEKWCDKKCDNFEYLDWIVYKRRISEHILGLDFYFFWFISGAMESDWCKCVEKSNVGFGKWALITIGDWFFSP